jgi:hypothetical protein
VIDRAGGDPLGRPLWHDFEVFGSAADLSLRVVATARRRTTIFNIAKESDVLDARKPRSLHPPAPAWAAVGLACPQPGLARTRPRGREGSSRRVPLSPGCAEQNARQPRPWLDQVTVSGPHLAHGDRSQTCRSTNRQLCRTIRRAEYDHRTASCPR